MRKAVFVRGCPAHCSRCSYVEKLGGVVVLYRDVKIKDKVGKIMQDRPHISFSAQAKFLVFAPQVGNFLGTVVARLRPCSLMLTGCSLSPATAVGEVTKVSHDHIAVLVHGVFFVTIGKDVIPAELSFDSKSERWRHSSAKDGSRDIAVGGFVRFRVARCVLAPLLVWPPHSPCNLSAAWQTMTASSL